MTLITLPPYSAELNGIENLWHDFRSHCWSNRVCANDGELFEVASTTWCQNCLDPNRIKSVCAKRHPNAQIICTIRIRQAVNVFQQLSTSSTIHPM